MTGHLIRSNIPKIQPSSNIRYAEDKERYYEALALYDEDSCADALTCLIAERAIEQLNYCIEIAQQQAAHCVQKAD